MVPVVITAMLSLLYSVRGIKENRKERKRCSANNSDPHFPYLSLFLFVLFFFCIDSRILIVFFSSFAFLMRATLVNNGKHTSPMVYTMCDRFVYCFNTPGFFVLFFWIVGKHQKNSFFFFFFCMQKRVPTRVKYYPGCFLNHWHSRLAGHNTWPPHHPYTATCIIYFSFYLFFFLLHSPGLYVSACHYLFFFSAAGSGGGVSWLPNQTKNARVFLCRCFPHGKNNNLEQKRDVPFFFISFSLFCPFFFFFVIFFFGSWVILPFFFFIISLFGSRVGWTKW